MRLVRAELTKLRRPLTLWVTVAAVVASLAFAWQGVRNAAAAQDQSTTSAPAVPKCGDFGLPRGALCDRAIAVQEQITAYRHQQAASQPDSRHNAHPTDALPVENPLGAGKVATGFMASLAGALLIFLLAAAHVANEWNARTVKTLLTQEGRRWRVLAAKMASLWLASLGIVIVDWVALALLSPVLKAAYPLAGPSSSWSSAWTAVAADAARLPLVLAVFTVVGVAAGVVVRNALGAFLLAGSFLLASLLAAGNLSGVAPWTLTWWVAGWMQFRSHGFVIYHFWVDAFPGAAHPPGALIGGLGLVVVMALAGAAAVAVLHRVDISN
jgi:hypothetical protein